MTFWYILYKTLCCVHFIKLFKINDQINCFTLQELLIATQVFFWDFLYMSPIRQKDYKEHSVLKTSTLH